MAELYLKYRTRFTSSLKNELVPLYDKLSQDTRIPKSRLLDEAIEDLLIKYGVSLESRQDEDSVTIPSVTADRKTGTY